MQYKRKRGLSISALSLGTVQLGMSYGIANRHGKPVQAESFQILTEAVQGGITCFDTAHAYGDSEQVLGAYFKDKDKTKHLIITKMRLNVGQEADHKQVTETMYRIVEQSLERLGLDRLPIMMIHHADELAGRGEVVIETFQHMIREGLVEKAGVSLGANVYEQQRQHIWPIIDHDLFEVVQIPINILDRRLLQAGYLQRLKQAGKVVFARSLFLQGVLFLEPERLPAHLQVVKPALEMLRSLADEESMTLAQMAISYVRDLEAVDSLVIGAETPQQVRQNVEWIKGPSLSERAQQKLHQQLGDLPEHILDPSQWNQPK